MNLGERVNQMGKQILALVIVTAVLSLGALVTSFGVAVDGEVYGYTRIGLALIGLAGAVLVLVGNDYGKMGLMVISAWAAVQSVYYATVPGGNFTRQLFDGFAGASSSTTVNGDVTQFSAVGINLVGIVMLVLAYACRKQLTDWENRATRGFQI